MGAACAPARHRSRPGAASTLSKPSSSGSPEDAKHERDASESEYFDALGPEEVSSPPKLVEERSRAYLGPMPVKIDLAMSEHAVKTKASAEFKNTISDPDPSRFLVRGPRYLSEAGTNLKHLKQPGVETPYAIEAVQEIVTPRRMPHFSQEIGKIKRHFDSFPADDPSADELPLFFVFNWVLQSLGAQETIVVNHIFKRRAGLPRDPALMNAFRRFMASTDAEKSAQFKFMFKVVDAPATLKGMISMLGGERPVLISKQLKTSFYRGRNYLEIDVDVSSSKIAAMLNSTIFAKSGTLVHEHCWLLQADRQDELPERILALLRWNWNVPAEVEVHVDDRGEVVSSPTSTSAHERSEL